MQTLGILNGKTVNVDGVWIGTCRAVHINGTINDNIKATLEVELDEDSLERLKEYAVILDAFGVAKLERQETATTAIPETHATTRQIKVTRVNGRTRSAINPVPRGKHESE